MIDSIRQYRSFGHLFAVILGLIVPAVVVYKHGSVGIATISAMLVGLALIAVSRFRPVLLAVPYRLWMGLARILNRIMTGIIITIVFFGIITPIGLVRQWKGGPVPDSFRTFRDGNARSYWHRRHPGDTPSEHYTRQY